MQWTEEKDMEMLRQMAASGIFTHKCGSRERGQVWQNIAAILNLMEGYAVNPRSVRDRFTNLMRKYKAKNNKEIRGSGLGGDPPTEFDTLLEDLIELSDECDLKHELAVEEKKNSANLEQQKALEVRQTAMERMSETKKRNGDENEEPSSSKRNRRSTSETIDFLRQKMAHDKELQEQKEAKRCEKINLQKSQMDQTTNMLTAFQSSIQQQAVQHADQQRNILQLINQQQQQFQMFMTMFSQNKNNDKN